MKTLTSICSIVVLALAAPAIALAAPAAVAPAAVATHGLKPAEARVLQRIEQRGERHKKRQALTASQQPQPAAPSAQPAKK